MKKKRHLLLLLTLNLLLVNLHAEPKHSRHQVGLLCSRGSQQLLYELSPGLGYFYNYTAIQLQYFYRLKQNEKNSVHLVLLPQINFSRYKVQVFDTTIHPGFEFGLNGGFVYQKSLTKQLDLYAMLTSGPHYVSGTPMRQAKGFIFSDNLCLGSFIAISQQIKLDIRAGIRHISNANIKMPNGGVNNLNLGFGLNYQFR